MDEETSPLIFSEFNISDALRETAESFTDFALSKDHELKIAIDEEIVYRGDEYAIRQLASILIDNAVKYASDGSDIEFSLEKAKKGIIIKTSNKCAGIEKGDCLKLFDRFYRQDESRSAGTGASVSDFPSPAALPKDTAERLSPKATTVRALSLHSILNNLR